MRCLGFVGGGEEAMSRGYCRIADGVWDKQRQEQKQIPFGNDNKD